jgi:hypothetical protein
MSKHIPQGVIAVAFMALALSLSYGLAAARHLDQLWLVPVSLAFTGIGVLGVAVTIKLREYGTRLAALEGRFTDPPGAGRSPPSTD